MSRELLLALDLGTTRVCALLLDPSGTVRGRAEGPLAAHHPAPGRVEQDPEALWERSVEALRAALADGRASARDVAGLGVVTQRATALAWDAHGRPLAPALGWQDQRTADRVAGLRARGIPITTLASATKLAWLLGEVPEVAAAARGGCLRLGTPDAWLTARLCGAFATDPGQASCTGLYDAAGGDWSDAACRLFGVPRDALPEVVPSAAPVGETPAALLGAPVPVVARAGDQQAACFAQAAFAPGDAKLTLGTSAMLDVHAESAAARPPRGAYLLALWRLPEGGDRFAVEGTVVTAGALVEWLVALGVLPAPDVLDAVASKVASADGVILLPALQGLGTPWMDDAVRGQILGLTRGTTRAHLARAALDGIAQRVADVAEALGARAALPTDGGLARSRILCQRVADLAGLPVERAPEVETTARGAALLAGLATGVLPDLAACRALRLAGEPFEPRLAAADREAERARWKEAVAAARHAAAPPADARRPG